VTARVPDEVTGELATERNEGTERPTLETPATVSQDAAVPFVERNFPLFPVCPGKALENA
jgi:hypothetical protein